MELHLRILRSYIEAGRELGLGSGPLLDSIYRIDGLYEKSVTWRSRPYGGRIIAWHYCLDRLKLNPQTTNPKEITGLKPKEFFVKVVKGNINADVTIFDGISVEFDSQGSPIWVFNNSDDDESVMEFIAKGKNRKDALRRLLKVYIKGFNL